MKKKWIIILISVVIISLVVVSVVYAFTMGLVDGVWSAIDTSGGVTQTDAICSNWATNPPGGSNDFDNPSSISSTSPSIQGTIGGTDWNQVRYGSRDFDYGDCNCSSQESTFANQSGFGFDGVDDVLDPSSPYVNQPFLLGKWCHFNNPIYNSACDYPNDLEYVDLTLQTQTIRCDPASTNPGLVPTPNDILDFTYRFYLDETPNNGPACGGLGQPACSCPSYNGFTRAPCPYSLTPGDPNSYCPGQPGVNVNGCADEVQIGSLPVADTFTCGYGGGTSTTYKIQILGFQPLANAADPCPTTPTGVYSDTYISQESGDRCACLYAKVTEATGTAVELDYFTATEVEQAVELKWETTSEVDNLGFNLYRNQEGEEGWVKLNAELIPTVVYPGAPFGGEYSFTDTEIEPGQTYFYWLMDMDNHGTASLHGPVEVTTAAK